jgi:hypothetical protein
VAARFLIQKVGRFAIGFFPGSFGLRGIVFHVKLCPMAEVQEQSGPATSLFAVEDGDDDDAPVVPDVRFINVTRWDGGAKVTAPRLFRAEELADQGALFALYGGGRYELLGRDVTNSRIIAKRALNLPGPSKPMHDDQPSAAPQAGAPDVADLLKAMVAMQQPQQAAGFNWQAVVALAGALAPVLGQWLQTSATRDAEAQRRHHEFMAALLQQQQGASDKLVATMGQLYSSGGAGGGGEAQFRKGIEWATEFMAGKAEAAAGAGEEFNIKDLLPLLTEVMKQQQAPAQAVLPTNGAAS